jgi:hypothetical protein
VARTLATEWRTVGGATPAQTHRRSDYGSDLMAKKSRKRRARAKKKANHGKRPNA